MNPVVRDLRAESITIQIRWFGLAVGYLLVNFANLVYQTPRISSQFALNAIGPALVLSHAHDLLPRDRPSVLAVLSARVGSIGDNRIGGWISYRSAKAAVNQIVHTAAIELARTHKQAAVVSLHPGTVATAFTEKYLGRHPAVPAQDAAGNLIRVIEGLSVAQTGQFFDYSGASVPW